MKRKKTPLRNNNPDILQQLESNQGDHALDGVKRRRIEESEDENDSIETAASEEAPLVQREEGVGDDENQDESKIEGREISQCVDEMTTFDLLEEFIAEQQKAGACESTSSDGFVLAIHKNEVLLRRILGMILQQQRVDAGDDSCDMEPAEDRLKSFLEAVLDFRVLEVICICMNQSTASSLELDMSSIDPSLNNSLCLFKRLITFSNDCSKLSYFRPCVVTIHLTTQALKCAAPAVVSNYLLGRNCAPSCKGKGKSFNYNIQASLSLRRSLGALFPNSLIEAVNIKSSNLRDITNPVKAQFVYSVVDNVQISQRVKCQEVLDNSGTSNRRNDQESIVVEGLKPTLRLYQSYAVEWMVSREKNPVNNSWQICWVAIIADDSNSNKKVVPLQDFLETNGSSDNISNYVLFNPFTAWICTSIDDAFSSMESIIEAGNSKFTHGGILAESMGLGKTIEVSISCFIYFPCRK